MSSRSPNAQKAAAQRYPFNIIEVPAERLGDRAERMMLWWAEHIGMDRWSQRLAVVLYVELALTMAGSRLAEPNESMLDL